MLNATGAISRQRLKVEKKYRELLMDLMKERSRTQVDEGKNTFFTKMGK